MFTVMLTKLVYFNVLNRYNCRELLSLSTLRNHPHVVGLEEVYLTPHHLAIVMEYAGANLGCRQHG